MPGGKHKQPQAERVEQHGDILPALPSTGRKLSLSFSPKLAPILYHLSLSNTLIESLHFILQCFKKKKKKHFCGNLVLILFFTSDMADQIQRRLPGPSAQGGLQAPGLSRSLRDRCGLSNEVGRANK